MVSAAEGAGAKQGIAANLSVGVETLSENDQVTFTQYARVVLPTDGSVFWVKTNTTMTVQGSLHYSTDQDQNEAETQGVSRVIFSALSPVQEFNDVQPNTMWIGTYAGDDEGDDGPITFAFSSRGKYYKAADEFHYAGIAVLPIFQTQLVDSTQQLTAQAQIVSNSLPIWLVLSNYTPPYPGGLSSTITLYPSFLVPDNLPPPYGVIHVDPRGTLAMQSAPHLGHTLSHYALCRDIVRITLYGLDNCAAMNFFDAVLQYSYDYNRIGLMNTPTIIDEKVTQTEINVIAQKKTIDFEVSYFQETARTIARQLIENAIAAVTPFNPTEWPTPDPYAQPTYTGDSLP